jgi:hypothetical protein
VLAAFRGAAAQSRKEEQLAVEAGDLRVLLGLSSSASLVKTVAALASQAREFEQSRRQIETDRTEIAELLRQTKSDQISDMSSREWETWARRMHGLIADNFSTSKSPKTLQRSLEEAIISNIGQRPLKRHLEVLRMEKALLMRGVMKSGVPGGRRPPELSAMICVVAALYRLRKLAGYLPTTFAGGAASPPDRQSRAKHFPIVNVV